MSADGVGIMAIARATGVDGLLRDATRPPGTAPTAADKVAEIVALTQKPPPHEATH